jgi:hypothetical protein
MQQLIYLSQAVKFFELLAAIVGFLYWKKIIKTPFKWMPIYLLLLFGGEMLAFYLTKQKLITEKFILYNWILIPLQFLFFYWLFATNVKALKKAALLFAIIYIIFLASDNLYLSNKKFIFSSISYSIGSTMLLLLIVGYIINLTKDDTILNFKRQYLFWISIGLMVFYLGSLPYFGLRNTLFNNYNSLFINYTWIIPFLNYTMYTLFILSFIWGRQK